MLTKITTAHIKEKKRIKYSINSEIAVFNESLNKSKVEAGT
jgi:hypothetical protein